MKKSVVICLCCLLFCVASCTSLNTQAEDEPIQSESTSAEEPVKPTETSIPTLAATPTPAGGGSGKIAYYYLVDDPSATCDIRIVDVETNEVQFITSPKSKEQFTNPRWSPDGSEIVMMHGECCKGHSIAFLDANDFHYIDMFPLRDYIWTGSYGPDGQSVVFAARKGGNIDLYSLDRNSGEWTQITDDDAGDIAPDWHPASDQIVFSKNLTGFSNIAVINRDGTGFRMLTNIYATESNPRWSPDGTKILFESDRAGNDEIFMMNADGTGVRNITNHPEDDKDPTWSPDGTYIAFTSLREPFGIYIMNLESEEVQFIADGRTPDWAP